MERLNRRIILERFFRELREAKKRILFLDYDGTLAPFRIERNKATPYPGVREQLEYLIEQNRTRLVLVTGRWIKDLLPLLGLKALPEIWGSNGWERLLPPRSYELLPIQEQQIQGLAEADDWARERGLMDKCELKPGSIAIHWRGVPATSVVTIQESARRKWSKLVGCFGLAIKEFDGGMELRAPQQDRGQIVRQVLADADDGTCVAYLGDDWPDEVAFRSLGDRGLRVLVRRQLYSTIADVWVRPPDDLIKFLERWVKACA